MPLLRVLCPLAARHLNWTGWEALIARNGLTIDRPHGTPHPRFPTIIYPLDYGYINHTISSDGEGVDVFVGSAQNGLVAALLTTDHRQGDRECTFVYNCTPEEIYCAHGFINYDPTLLEGVLVMRQPMHELWTP